jgi:hypothetical protein
LKPFLCCLSRACLGKLIVFAFELAQNTSCVRFPHLRVPA